MGVSWDEGWNHVNARFFWAVPGLDDAECVHLEVEDLATAGEKTNMRDRQTDRPTDRQKYCNRQTGRQTTDRHINTLSLILYLYCQRYQ